MCLLLVKYSYFSKPRKLRPLCLLTFQKYSDTPPPVNLAQMLSVFGNAN